jgi:hypothetical protein
MATYRFPRMLTLLAWEAELRKGPFAGQQAWLQATAVGCLHLDFSRVEFADFGALARALLLLDAAVKQGIRATVTLPTATIFLAGERAAAVSTLAARRARARGDARAFMRQVGFMDCLRAPHWGIEAVRVLDRAAAGGESGSSSGAPERDSYEAPYERRRAFPFRWLEPIPAVQLREAESFVAVSAGLEDLGLSRSDARTLSQTVLTELVENVAEHGGGDRPPVALVGAILLPADNYGRHQDGVHAHMAEVAERARTDGSNVLRLIVADSGADLTARLAPTHGQRSSDADSAQDRLETILAALGNRHATAVSGAGERHGTSGLWWVARVVRSYHGAVEARTADLLAGLVFGREADGTRVTEAGFGYVPGTLLELTLPTGPSPPRPRTGWVSLPEIGAAPNLRWVKCTFDPQRGLTDADRVRLVDQIHAPAPGRDPDGLIVTIAVHGADYADIDDRWRGAIHQLLEFATSIARWGTVVVAFPDAEPHILDSCVAAFNEEVAAVDEDAHDSILVVGRHGEPAWCGGSHPLRAVLTLLSENKGVADFSQAEKCWRQAGGEPSQLSGTLRTNGHLLTIDAKKLQLRLSLSAVHETVAREVSENLAGAISQGGEAVARGTFRGPTLRLTSRWIYVGDLLARTVGGQLAAFVLARKVEAALRAYGQEESPTAVVQVGSARRPVARYLSECLTLGGRYYLQEPELNVDELPIGEQVPVGAKVVLYTSLISTENTVRRAVAMVAGREAEPLAIACVIDARAAPGPVRLLNRAIPVVSLAEVDVGSSGSADDAVTDIDPLMLRPRAPAGAESAPAQGADLLAWSATARDSLRLGHIDEPHRRHYSAFVKIEPPGRQEPRNQITDAVLSNVKRALTEIRAEDDQVSVRQTPIAIWYIPSDGHARRLAEIVQASLVAEGFQVSAVTPVPRWIVGDAWAFPASLSDVVTPAGVLIIHWWAISGTSLLQLVRLAAKSGASWIAAVCMLNQLEPNDADFLRMLRAVSAPAAAADTDCARSADGQPHALTIPVTIRFVALSSITAFDARGCPICATQERYRLDDDAAPPRLIKHAKLLDDMLRPRELDEVARDSAADLFTVPITSGEAIDYLRWRGLLLRARRTVSARQEVIDRLRALIADSPSEQEWTSDGLVRLLAAEQQWLRLPPLYFETAADLLSQVCVNSFERVTAPSWLRVQALMVMAAAVPQSLVELLPRLLAAAGNEAVLIDQMLLDCCRLLLRAPGNLPIDLAQLRHNLLQCRDYLEAQRSEPDATATEDHLYAVRDLLTIADYRILIKPEGPQAAWERLREDLVRPVIRHRLEARLLVVRNFVEDIDRVEPSEEAARPAEAEWDACARQLEERALINLRPLREILDGDFVSDWLGTRDQRRLLTLARPHLGELRAMTESLHTLAHGPWRPADPSWQATRRELLDRLHWWNRIFLAVHISDHEMPALLVELVRSAPVKLGPCVAELLGSHQARATFSGTEHGQVEVFCPERLLDQVVAHLLENTEKHRLEGATCRLHVVYLPPGENTMRMVVRNSGTVTRTPPGRGLRALNDKLKPFGGSLTYEVPAEDEWTFAVIVRLPLWHGG